MTEKKAPQKRSLLPIYRSGHVTDGICIGLIFIGMLLTAGFFSNTPGSLIMPFCAMLRSWFGIWAIILAILIVVLSISVLVLRWIIPQIRCSKGKQILCGKFHQLASLCRTRGILPENGRISLR